MWNLKKKKQTNRQTNSTAALTYQTEIVTDVERIHVNPWLIHVNV